MHVHRIWYVVGVAAVLVVLAVLVRGRQQEPAAASPTPTPTLSVTAPTPTPSPKATSRVRATPKPPTPTYADVAQQYAGRRIEFDPYCQVVPVESTFTDGMDVLLDNRSPDDRVVALGGVQHGLRSYGWKVVTMTAPELPAVWAVDCGTLKNVGKITIQPLTTPTPEPTVTASASPDFSPPASASESLTPTP